MSDDSTVTLHEITSRDELILFLQEAAEIEHALLCQYLFAAFSLKDERDGLTHEQAETTRRWKRTLLQIAHQEMEHLLLVNNILLVIGSNVHLSRPPFPVKDRYFPPPDGVGPAKEQRFSLEPLTLATAQRFVAFEAPFHPDALRVLQGTPTQPRYLSIGQLYNQIYGVMVRPDSEKEKGYLRCFDSKNLFVARKSIDTHEWSTGQRKTDWNIFYKDGVKVIIKNIIEEGEGGSKNSSVSPNLNSHHQLFMKMCEEIEILEGGAWNHCRNMVFNPVVMRENYEDVHELTGVARSTAELFDDLYNLLLLAIYQIGAFPDKNSELSWKIKDFSRRLMTAVLRPLGEVLSLMPANEGATDGTAGPPFRVYSEHRLAANVKSQWNLFLILLDDASLKCEGLYKDIDKGGVNSVNIPVHVRERTRNIVMNLSGMIAHMTAFSRSTNWGPQ